VREILDRCWWGAGCVNGARPVLRGERNQSSMVEISWHRRETRRQTENTNFNLNSKDLTYSPKVRLRRITLTLR